jgi:hypothetical protein
MKSMWIGMATLVARKGEKRDGVLAVGKLEKRDHLEDLRRTRKENIEWMLKKQDGLRNGVLAVGKLEERDHLEDLDVHGRKTLNGC